MSKFVLIVFLFSIIHSKMYADEGFWLFDQFPQQAVKEKYGVEFSKQELIKIQKASLKMGSSCSGSFISSKGLILTNHHCVRRCIRQLSNEENNYIAKGFYAKSQNQEIKCPSVVASQLTETTDVTSRFESILKTNRDKNSKKSERELIRSIENECSDAAKNISCKVISHYNSQNFYLYKYQQFKDIRLVFAPEFNIAFAGGDEYNFMFPRYSLDMSLLRAYQSERPVKSSHYFEFSKQKINENDFTLVAGYPSLSRRDLTSSELKFLRDIRLPEEIKDHESFVKDLLEFQSKGEEERLVVLPLLQSTKNKLKSSRGRLEFLKNSHFISQLEQSETSLKAAEPDPFDDIDKALKSFEAFFIDWRYLTQVSYGSELLWMGHKILNSTNKAVTFDMLNFSQSNNFNLGLDIQRLFNNQGLNEKLEVYLIKRVLDNIKSRTSYHELTEKLFLNESPETLAQKIVSETKIKDLKYRIKLYGDKTEVQSSDDILFSVLNKINQISNKLENRYTTEVKSVIAKSKESIQKLKVQKKTSARYPEASASFRLSYGAIKNIHENEPDNKLEVFTDMNELFKFGDTKSSFSIPESWMKRRSHVNLKTKLNMITTNDCIGGNSGSPMLNKNKKLVGLAFDGNKYRLSGNYFYDEDKNRTIAVSVEAIIEALTKIYKTKRINQELKISR